VQGLLYSGHKFSGTININFPKFPNSQPYLQHRDEMMTGIQRMYPLYAFINRFCINPVYSRETNPDQADDAYNFCVTISSIFKHSLFIPWSFDWHNKYNLWLQVLITCWICSLILKQSDGNRPTPNNLYNITTCWKYREFAQIRTAKAEIPFIWFFETTRHLISCWPRLNCRHFIFYLEIRV